MEWPPFLEFILVSDSFCILIHISLKRVPKNPNENKPPFIQRIDTKTDDMAFSKPVVVIGLLTHLCVTWPGCVDCIDIWTPLEYPKRRLIVRSREVSKP